MIKKTQTKKMQDARIKRLAGAPLPGVIFFITVHAHDRDLQLLTSVCPAAFRFTVDVEQAIFP
jgi:hypothetical protein